VSPATAGPDLSAVHSRFARAVLLIYLGTAVVAVGLLVAALATDLAYQEEVARGTLLLETQVHAYYLGQHLRLLAGELSRLGLRSEVNLLDRNSEPERSLLRLTHEKSAFFNVGVAVIGQDGAAVWSEPQTFLPPGESLASEPWFQAVLRTRTVLIAPVQPERERDSVLYMVSPILRGGAFQGVLLGAIDLAHGGALGTEFHPGTHGLNVLVTRTGVVIYPPKPPAFSSGDEWKGLVGRHPDEPFLDEATLALPDDASGQTRAPARTVIAGSPVQGTEFLLLALSDTRLFFGPARARLLTRLGLGLGLALVPLLVLVFLLRRSFRVFEASEQVALRGERLRMLGEAVNLIAHEVKNSLNGLRVGLDLILQGDRFGLESRHRQAVAGLRTEMERLSNFTTELLSFSKGVVPRPVPLDLADLSRKVTDLLRGRASDLGVALEVATAGPVPVQADPTLVHIIITNLVGNALEALSGDHLPQPRVRVVVERRGPSAVLCVQDNGPGVAARIRPRLFEPFVTGKPSGVGIGLALSRNIARAHGGDLALEEGGPGATFLLTLPLAA
jgi:signal transduction histidine kinase